jgi:acyl-CoA synthetase (AMP-forming)/AMP-acid ligase II
MGAFHPVGQPAATEYECAFQGTGHRNRMRIESFLERSAAVHGCEAVTVIGRARHTYGELDIKSARLAAALQRRGVARGDRVALYVDDAWAAVLSVFAVLRAGATLSFVDPDLDTNDLAPALAASHPVGVVTEARLASAAAAALGSVASVRLVVLALGDRTRATDTCLSMEDIVNRIGSRPELVHAGDSGDPAVVRAGGEPLSHAAIAEAAQAQTFVAGTMPMPPLAGLDGMAMLVAAIGAGATLVARPGDGCDWPRGATNDLWAVAR